MEGSLTAMVRMLRPLGVYTLEQGSLVDRELMAYAAGFSVVEELLRDIRQRAFVQSATGEQLKRHERLVGLQERQNTDEEARRALVIYRLGVAPYDFHREGMKGSIRAAGMDADITEYPGEERIEIRSNQLLDNFLDLDSVKQSVETMLPAHLLYEFDIGFLTWDMMDDADAVWDRWDQTDMTWTEFDINGHTLLSGEDTTDA